MKIIVGLGNPGNKYEKTRHNAGFMVLDHLANATGLTWEYNKKFNADIIKNGETIYVKPQTFMNNSGQPVQIIMSFYKLLPYKMGLLKAKDADLAPVLTVVHDDLDLPLGEYKLSIDSRAAGHNGVQSIIDQLKTKNFRRLRLGIQTERPAQMTGKDFVLGKFTAEELETINATIIQLSNENFAN